MIPFSLGQIAGLLLFFIGLKVLRRCSRLERKEQLKRKIHETMLMVRSNWQVREATGKSGPNSTFLGLTGTLISLMGMVLFFIY
jgi:uncharacterized membrane protein